MIEVIGVRFRGGCKEYYFDPHGTAVEVNQFVIVETAQGSEFAQCVSSNHEVEDVAVVQPLRPLVRIATENDCRTFEYNKTREKEAFGICEKKIAERGLDMKLVRVESNFDSSKIIFFFTSDGRVDFRELVRDLAGVFRARIELRQIGVRDEAKMLGGLGICGRPFCCAQFLDDFVPVSIKMAKTQNLSLNPTKISGTCGRLMCCLKYEQDAYEDAVRRCPKQDSFVATPDGLGNVTTVDLLREQVVVKLDTQGDGMKRYRNCEIKVLRNGKGSREGIDLPKELPERWREEKQEPETFILPTIDEPAVSERTDFPAGEQIAEDKPRRSHRGGRNRRGGKGRSSGENRAARENDGEQATQTVSVHKIEAVQTRKGEAFHKSEAVSVRKSDVSRKAEGSPARRNDAAHKSGVSPVQKAEKGDAEKRRRSHHRGGRGRRHSGGSSGSASSGQSES